MLVKFTDDYINYIFAGYEHIAKLQYKISTEEPHIGAHPKLDKWYAQSILVNGIIDLLENDDNSKPLENEKFLQCLKSLLVEHHCKVKLNSVKYRQRYPGVETGTGNYIVEELGTPTYITTHLNERLIY